MKIFNAFFLIFLELLQNNHTISDTKNCNLFHNMLFASLIFQCRASLDLLNSRTPRDLTHFGNPKNEKLLISPILYGENKFQVQMCISQLITEILSFFYFDKNFMTSVSFQIAKNLSLTQHFQKYWWIWLTP